MRFKFLFVVLMIVVCGGVSSFAQQPAPTDKKSLILEFRKVTGADKVNLRLNFSITDVQANLLALVEQDKEITDAQKTELKKSAKEAGERLDNEVKAFFVDPSKTAPVAEEIIYQIYDKTFTEVELRELIAFYRTPTGQKALVFLPGLSNQFQQAFAQAVVPMIQNLIQPKIQAETEQLKEKLKDAKAKKSTN